MRELSEAVSEEDRAVTVTMMILDLSNEMAARVDIQMAL
jgi:hypothetical protein